MKELTIQNNKALSLNNLQRQRLEKIVRLTDDEQLRNFVVGQVMMACVYRGINKSEQEQKVIAEMFLSEIKQRFSFLATTQIARYLRNNKYGADFSNTVSPLALVECLEKSNSVFEMRNNRDLLEQVKEQEQTKEPEVMTRKQEIECLRRGFDYWQKTKKVNDLSGLLWKIARTMNYTPTPADRMRYLSYAKAETYLWFYKKDKYRFLSSVAVKNNKKFCQSKQFRRQLCCQYQEQWLRDFFRRCKWNKTTQNQN